MVNPRLVVPTKDVFQELGLRNGELLVGAADVIEAVEWPQDGTSIHDWLEALGAIGRMTSKPLRFAFAGYQRGVIMSQGCRWSSVGADVRIGCDLLCAI